MNELRARAVCEVVVRDDDVDPLACAQCVQSFPNGLGALDAIAAFAEHPGEEVEDVRSVLDHQYGPGHHAHSVGKGRTRSQRQAGAAGILGSLPESSAMPARFATRATSPSGSIGLVTWAWNPAAKARRPSSARA